MKKLGDEPVDQNKHGTHHVQSLNVTLRNGRVPSACHRTVERGMRVDKYGQVQCSRSYGVME